MQMNTKKSIFTFIFILLALLAFPQQNQHEKTHTSHYSLLMGIGWTHYFNNLDYGDQNMRKDFTGISIQSYWEPEYKLSLGVETGYYKLFEVRNKLTQDITAEVDRTAVPILLLVRMRIIDNFYLGAGFGVALIKNLASGTSVKITTNTWSLSNYKAAASYLYPVKTRLKLGGEMNLYNYGNINDWMYSIQALISFRF
jgi:hypothetical protein